MAKKCLFASVLALFIAGGVFAQVDFELIPKNTVTVDIGPTIVGLSIAGLGNRIGDSDVGTTGFGIAAQYERQILEKLGVAFRFSYLGGGIGISEKDDYGNTATLEMKLHSFSLEGHARFYPFGRAFFLDGMLGYGYMGLTLSGKVTVTDENTGKKQSVSASDTTPRNYLKFGAKLGWRIDFGRPGGFIFEPSFGWSFAHGLGDTLGKQLMAKVGGDAEDAKDYDDMFALFEKYGLGGPRLSLAFGARF